MARAGQSVGSLFSSFDFATDVTALDAVDVAGEFDGSPRVVLGGINPRAWARADLLPHHKFFTMRVATCGRPEPLPLLRG